MSSEATINEILGSPPTVTDSVPQSGWVSAQSPLSAKSLKRLAVRGSLWTIMGYGTSQMLRFGSNLILTRILFPEAFGLMAIVMLVWQGLTMFSDVGIGPAIISHPRGQDPEFFNTAWTIQLARGVLLWLMGCLLAIPIAHFYRAPELGELIPVVTFAAVMAGLNSTNLFAENRQMRLGLITCIDLASQVVTLCVMIGAAWYWRSVWSLAIGGVIGAGVKAGLSHFALPGPANRIHWDHEMSKELFSFGRWIFLATLLGFCANQLDRIVLGRLVPLELFGAFYIAYALSDVFRNIMTMLGGNVFLPAYSHDEQNEHVNVGEAIYSLRKLFLFGSGFLIALFVVFGDQLIYFLYDRRHAPAAEVLPILIAGLWPRALFFTVGPALFARGKTSYNAIASLLRLVVVGAGLWLFYRYLGPKGVFAAVALADLPHCIIIHYGLRRERMDYGKLNWMATIWTVACVVLFLSVRKWIGLSPVPFLFAMW